MLLICFNVTACLSILINFWTWQVIFHSLNSVASSVCRPVSFLTCGLWQIQIIAHDQNYGFEQNLPKVLWNQMSFVVAKVKECYSCFSWATAVNPVSLHEWPNEHSSLPVLPNTTEWIQPERKKYHLTV